MPPGELTAEALVAMRHVFAEEHERTYGHRLGTDAGVEVVAFWAVGTVRSVSKIARHAPNHADHAQGAGEPGDLLFSRS